MTQETEQERAARATQYLIDSAAEIAAAKADLVRAENMLRVTKALVMKSSEAPSAAKQEVEAYASEYYQQAVDDVTEATRAFEELRAKREAAKMRIEYFRSVNANYRAAERGFHAA